MFRSISLAAVAVVIATPAFASGATCSKSTSSKFQPVATLKTQLESEGMKVAKIKTEGGCYEAYVTNKSGKKVNMAFNAETLEQVDNPEAGEN
jgi:hypothetical protein